MDDPLRLLLELDADDDAIAGRVRLEIGGPPQAFRGWIGLAAALEHLRDLRLRGGAGPRER